MSEFNTVGTKDGGFELIVVGSKGEGFDDCGVRAVHLEHVDSERLGVTEKMEGKGTRVVFWESSEIRVAMGIELSNISN